MHKGLIRAVWALLLAMSGLAGLIFYFLVKAPLPPEEGSRELAGLRAAGQIDFDELGIPRITAENAVDVYLALGFVTGGDSLFQMDLLRRKTAGRLAEIFGDKALKVDRWNR